jgi:Ras-related C3 botulinum toxin substrate 1
MDSIKCVVVGDGSVGKTCLLLTYTTNAFTEDCTVTVFDNFSVNITVDNRLTNLQLWDTAGQEGYGCFRGLIYPSTNVFLVCFALDSLTSFENVQTDWIPEIRGYSISIPIVLAGLKSDLRDDASSGIVSPGCFVSDEAINNVCSKMRILAYVECSALRRYNLNHLFETVVRCVISPESLAPSSTVLDDGTHHCCLVL